MKFEISVTRSDAPTCEGIASASPCRYGTVCVGGETFHVREYGREGARERFVPPATLQIFTSPSLMDRINGAGYGTIGRVVLDNSEYVEPVHDPIQRALPTDRDRVADV